jgi:DNA polymerase-3 subunit delta
VVARDVGALTAGDVDGIVRYLDDPLDTTILVFVAGGGTIPPALSKKLKAVKAEERAPESEKTDKVLIGSAHAAGLLLSPDAANLISSHLGEDAGRVAALVDVLTAAYPPDVRVGVDEVTPYLGEAGTVPSYLLTNAIEAGDPAVALETLHRLLTVSSAQQPKPMHPLQVMGLLNGYYRRILRLDDPSVRSGTDAVEALGGKVKEYPARKALAQARALGAGGIRQAFDALFQADLDLKGARGIPEQAVMEVLVVRLTRLAARSGSGSGGRRR